MTMLQPALTLLACGVGFGLGAVTVALLVRKWLRGASIYHATKGK
jgi:hypothetical protein